MTCPMTRCLPLVLLPAGVSAWAGPASLPAATASGPASAGSLLQVLFGLVLVLALMAACAWLLRRFGASRSLGGAPLRIVGGVSVGTRERVMVVEVADQWIVVGVTPGRISALSTMPKQDATSTAPAGDAPTPRNFSNWLAQMRDKRNA